MVVGLDFGTHQTKICIEDRTDPARPTYRFWKFHTPEGDSYTLPSVIQINNDDTISYGVVDRSRAKYIAGYYGPEPKRPDMEEPTLQFTEPKPVFIEPKKPKTERKHDWKEVLQASLQGKTPEEMEWEQKYAEAMLDYEQDMRLWTNHYNRARDEYEQKKAFYDQKMADYAAAHAEWGKQRIQQEPAVFRYFKQATFCTSTKWKRPFEAVKLSILYLANIIFDLEEEYGQEFSTQMGFPARYSSKDLRKEYACRLLVSAFHLVEDVFAGDKEAFLAMPYTQLFELATFELYNREKVQELGILVLPEAFANLVTSTTKQKISKGISFVIDIGGGTTDISLFCLDEKWRPLIYSYTSVDKGINYIAEEAGSGSDIWQQNTINPITDAAAIAKYNRHIEDECMHILSDIRAQFRKVALSPVKLEEALANRVVVYSGGGSTYDFLCEQIPPFTDVKRMSQSIWSGFAIVDSESVRSLAPVLSTALGLSIQRNNDKIEVSGSDKIFAHLPQRETEGFSYSIAVDRLHDEMGTC